MRNLTIMLGTAVLAALPATAALAQSAPLAAPAPVAAPADAAKPAAPATQKTAGQISDDKDNEIICHREREIASLVKTKKTCHTRSQWAYIQAENQRTSRDFIIANTARPSGN